MENENSANCFLRGGKADCLSANWAIKARQENSIRAAGPKCIPAWPCLCWLLADRLGLSFRTFKNVLDKSTCVFDSGLLEGAELCQLLGYFSLIVPCFSHWCIFQTLSSCTLLRAKSIFLAVGRPASHILWAALISFVSLLFRKRML